MNNQIIGTCGKCGGPVVYLGTWNSVLPQIPKCSHCGSMPKNAFGPVLEMEDQKSVGEIGGNMVIKAFRVMVEKG